MSNIPDTTDIRFMRRALQLAQGGLGHVSPNPMVGCVVVSTDGQIIGEGWHRHYGHAHAEVNAINSIPGDLTKLLSQSTVYVTLEPCSHFGKTPPCVDLLVRSDVRRVVIGCIDPFGKVNGTGVEKLRNAGIEVTTGVLKEQCESLNARFFTAHTLHRPFVTLKWAQSADGFMDSERKANSSPARFSKDTGMLAVHRLRAHHDAIGVGSGTILADKPRLDVRYWVGDNPRRVVFDRRGRVVNPIGELFEVLGDLYLQGITSLLVEGGPTLLRAFISAGLWDLARIETAPLILSAKGRAKAPELAIAPFMHEDIGGNDVSYFSNNSLVNAFFVEHGL
ncbi:MAG: bifunctional diaminohydroxyphosphoribosylaminopyrimidine deaminase/5-amino-6-(5-phosphoribosylamino)uracil reductase RibD [Muribaculaceae bacterium]|nr:bifunctional diaminohydroxyphosphoribosylaminopyrimidine deaminase/5-amino-6-(5-phosphoribosylamino)uracil reductase RibD [Muribaculaceae bacterium]